MGRTNATACYRELGAELKKRRKAAGITARQVAEYTGWHHMKVSRIETGRSAIGPVDVIHYLGACGVYRAQALDLLALCRQAESHPGYWLRPAGLDSAFTSLIYHESTAIRSTSYEPQLIPGLLQTPAYARVRISTGPQTPGEVDTLVKIRSDRQAILYRPCPARFVFYVHEQALRLVVGSPAIMHEQLLHIVLVAALDHVTLRIVPAEAGERSVFGGPFRLLEYRDHAPLIYLDNIRSGLFLEDRNYVDDYRHLLPNLAAVALDEGQSRKFTAELADALDRGSPSNGAIYQLEEEHL